MDPDRLILHGSDVSLAGFCNAPAGQVASHNPVSFHVKHGVREGAGSGASRGCGHGPHRWAFLRHWAPLVSRETSAATCSGVCQRATDKCGSNARAA